MIRVTLGRSQSAGRSSASELGPKLPHMALTQYDTRWLESTTRSLRSARGCDAPLRMAPKMDGCKIGGPVLMLLYPLYASVMTIDCTSKLDAKQWLPYWILYSFLTLMEMLLQPILEWIPIWYDVKLLFVAWLVLPQFQGAALLYERYVRELMKKYRGWRLSDHRHHKSPNTINNIRANTKDVLGVHHPQERGTEGILNRELDFGRQHYFPAR
ncbi:HVA22-like protein d [Juglans microcarpa x Juglans regia]|uniref:HVA22-like protein d n=1 Tax=Juglans microcarpa x Juglans regia TaxID=2249226 RepID=UPI001B7EDF04|nr:HVA22-like protein d [Juglans microcarpa x Juglans regia]